MVKIAPYPPEIIDLLRAEFRTGGTREECRYRIKQILECTDPEAYEVVRDLELGLIPRTVGVYATPLIPWYRIDDEDPDQKGLNLGKRIDHLSRDEEEEVYKRVLRRRRAKTETRKAERKQELLDRLGMSFETLHRRLQENFTRCPACKGPMTPPIFDGSIADGKFTWHTAHVTGCGMQYRLTLGRS